MEAVMKVPKSRPKAKFPRTIPLSPPQLQQGRIDIADSIQQMVEQAKDEGDDSALISILVHVTVLTCPRDDLEGVLDTLPLKDVLRLQISQLIYGDDSLPDYALESAYVILNSARKPEDESREILAMLLMKLFSEPIEEEKKAEPAVRRKRSRYLHLR